MAGFTPPLFPSDVHATQPTPIWVLATARVALETVRQFADPDSRALIDDAIAYLDHVTAPDAWVQYYRERRPLGAPHQD